jgi:hypothetical protein
MPYGREVLVGRLDERLRIERLLEGARRGQSGALVISGKAGIGKTTLLRHAAERAGEMTVLSATGVPAEADLEYSGLLELARLILHRLDELSEHQRAALRESLGVDPPRARDRFVVAAALLSPLAAAAEQRPLPETWIRRSPSPEARTCRVTSHVSPTRASPSWPEQGVDRGHRQEQDPPTLIP